MGTDAMRFLVVDFLHRERPVRRATGNALVERRERLGGLVNLYHRRAARARDRLLAHDPAADRYSAAVALYALAIW
jgi:hypothetical protein